MKNRKMIGEDDEIEMNKTQKLCNTQKNDLKKDNENEDEEEEEEEEEEVDDDDEDEFVYNFIMNKKTKRSFKRIQIIGDHFEVTKAVINCSVPLIQEYDFEKTKFLKLDIELKPKIKVRYY